MFDNFTFSSTTYDCVPEGSYIAEYTGCEPVPSKYKEEEQAIAWRWKIIDGIHANKVVSRVSGTKPTPKNTCGKVIVALLGKTPNNNESVSVMECVGKKYFLGIVKTEGDKTRVESITRMPA